MKWLLSLYILFPGFWGLNAQDELPYVDYKARNIPATETHSTASIASYVRSNFTTDKERLRAIYTWVTANIRYDTDSMYSINWGGDPETKITAALRRRKGVCENYAAVFNDIALKCGLRSFVVSGYTRQSGSLDRSGHSWCAVFLEGEWFLCDPTWDVGFRSHTNYFLIRPNDFIVSHMPFDPIWQLLDYPLSHQEFSRGMGYSKKDKPYYNFVDSVNAFLQLDELHQLEASALRIRKAGIENEKLKNRLAFIEMKIGIVYEDKDMNLYNSAVADLNKALLIFNDFVHFRNSQFTPLKSDAAINAILDPIENIFSSAWIKLDKIGRSVENFQYDTGGLKERLAALAGRVQIQKDFLKRYFTTNTAEREKLFYR